MVEGGSCSVFRECTTKHTGKSECPLEHSEFELNKSKFFIILFSSGLESKSKIGHNFLE
jgi:hypothetical protein